MPEIRITGVPGHSGGSTPSPGAAPGGVSKPPGMAGIVSNPSSFSWAGAGNNNALVPYDPNARQVVPFAGASVNDPFLRALRNQEPILRDQDVQLRRAVMLLADIRWAATGGGGSGGGSGRPPSLFGGGPSSGGGGRNLPAVSTYIYPRYSGPTGGGMGPTGLPPPGGYGGGGGGGGGGYGGGGGGYGGGGYRGGGFGFGGGGFGRGFIAFEAAKEALLLPFQIASLAEQRAAAAAPIIEYRGRIQSMAAAMGTSSATLSNQFYGGSLTQGPEWMHELGLNPLQAMQMSVNFGIAGKSNNDQRKIVKALAMLNPRMGNIDTPGLGFLQNGQAESSAATAARYGYIEPTGKGIEHYGKFLSDMMTPAIAKGFDTSSLARSFDAAMTMMVRDNNVAPTKEAIGAYFSGFMSTAGGRTGEAAISFMQSESTAMGQVGKDVPHTIAEATSPLANVKSKEQLKAFLSRYPGAYDNIMKDPGMAMIVNQLPYMDDFQRNIQLSQIINQAAPQARFDIMRNNAITNSAPGVGGREFVTANLLDKSVSSVYTREIQSAADRNKIPTSLLTALIMRESSGDPRKVSAKGAKGLTQLMDATARQMGVAPGMVFDPLTNMNAGAGYLYQQYHHFGDWRQALEAYNWGPGYDKRTGIDHEKAIRSGNVPSSVKAFADEVINMSGIESNRTPIINAAVKDFQAKMRDALGVSAFGGEAGLYKSDLGTQETALVENSITGVINALKNFADALQSNTVNMAEARSRGAGAYIRGGSPPPTGH